MNDNAQLAQETVVEFLKQEVIATLPWPACSPDLNPINGGLRYPGKYPFFFG